MKKILLMAAAAAVLFSACSKENENPTGMLNVMLKLSNEGTVTKAIEAPGATGKLAELTNGHVFIIGSAGTITKRVALDVDAAKGAGQSIPSVSSDSRIFVLGNIPADVNVNTPTNLTELLATASAINSTTQTDYTKPAMGNVNGVAQTITATSATAGTAIVKIHPLYSRIELAKVTGTKNSDDDQVQEFKVTGVWVDSWHPQFTLAGKNAGTIYEQYSSTDFTLNTKGDVGNWIATGTAGNMVSIPNVGQSWVYHVPAGGLPRLIVRLTGVKYILNDGGAVVDHSAENYYITVKSYTVGGDPFTTFEAGKIYRIGGTAGITFKGEDNLYTVPNPKDIDLTLNVEIIDWQIQDLGVELY